MRKFIDIIEAAQRELPKYVYHGTCVHYWSHEGNGEPLYLATTRENAENYADQAAVNRCYELGINDASEDPSAKAIIVRFKLTDLMASPRLTFMPDWGWDKTTDHTSWKDTLHAVGSFCVGGFAERHKEMGEVSPAVLIESHDYNPEWDYEVVEPNPKVAKMVEEIMATVRAKVLPKLGFSDVQIFYSDDLGGAVGKYIYGTNSLPVFGVDVTIIEEGTMSPADFKRELGMTIVHELAHAYQESIGVLNDESGCDDPDLEYAAEAFAEDFIHHGFVNVSVLRIPLGED